MQVSPYTIFTRTDLAAIQSSLEHILSVWSEKWFISTASLPTAASIANAFEFDATAIGSEYHVERHSDKGACRFVYTARTHQKIYARTTGDHVTKAIQKIQPASLESSLLIKVLDDLMALVLNDPSKSGPATSFPYQDENADTPRKDFGLHKGSGAVVATIKDQDSIAHLYLSQGAARALCGMPNSATSAKLVSRKAVIGHGTLKIQVTAGEAELRLADLVDLKPGNVVRLNMKPDQPFIVQTADTHEKICRAYLGTSRQNKAIELIKQ